MLGKHSVVVGTVEERIKIRLIVYYACSGNDTYVVTLLLNCSLNISLKS